jgi:putative transposase
MLAAALEAEVDAYLAELANEREGRGRRLVVRNGHAQPRQVMTGAGAIEVRAPRVNDKRTDPVTGDRRRFRSAILPPWCRKSPKVAEVLPLLYLHGLSSGDFVPALEQFLGSAAGLSAAAITRLTAQWTDDYHAWRNGTCRRSTTCMCGPMGSTSTSASTRTSCALLVIVGVRTDGTKELVAPADGYCESTGSWADLLRDCARRGMRESTFATVRHRTRVTKGPGSRAAGLAMAFKLIEAAQDRWRAVNAPHLVTLVRAGATFINGKLVERPADTVAA